MWLTTGCAVLCCAVQVMNQQDEEAAQLAAEQEAREAERLREEVGGG